jgi:hypothetical protein
MNPRPTFFSGVRPGTASPVAPSVTVEPMTWDRVFPLLSADLQTLLLSRKAVPSLLISESLHSAKAEGYLARWLNSEPKKISNISPAQINSTDLSPWEAHAISSALGCEDLFLIDAEAGPTQWKLATAIASAKISQNSRVLILTASGSEADELLSRMVSQSSQLLIARAVGPMEDQSRLPASSANRTAASHGQQVLATAQQRVRLNLQRLEMQLSKHQNAIAAIEVIEANQPGLSRLNSDILDLKAKTIPNPSAELSAKHLAERSEIDNKLSAVRVQLVEKQTEWTKTTEELNQAKNTKAGLGGLFKSFFNSGPNLSQLESLVQTLDASIADLKRSILQLEDAHRQLLLNHDSELTSAKATYEAQLAQQQQTLSDLEQALGQAQTKVDSAASTLREIGHDLPTADSTSAWDTLKQKLASAVESFKADHEIAANWLKQLTTASPELTAGLLQLPQVVVGPFAAFGSDPLASCDARFHDVIVLGCEHRDEADLNNIAARTTRQTFIGDLLAINRAQANALRPHTNGNGKPHYPPVTPRGQAFRKLWNHLNHDSWVEEDGCLVAQLLKVEGIERGSLLREPLADRPEIEIRFLKQATGELHVAELAFPPGMQAIEAKTLLQSELGATCLTPCGLPEWKVSTDEILVSWPATQAVKTSGDWISLEAGVREYCLPVGRGGLTAAITFDKQLGWTEEAAREWLASHWSIGHTARLPRPLTVATEPNANRPSLARAVGGVV